MILILIVLSIVFIISSLLILFSLLEKKFKVDYESEESDFSIIIAAKNEEKNLPELFEHLNKLNYPEQSFEVIIVDDLSLDGTYNFIQKNIFNKSNYSIYSTENHQLPSKKSALTTGISKAKYPFIVITDADCKPDRNWLRAINRKFNDGFEMLIGVAPYIQRSSLLNRYICFENLRTHILTFSFVELGLPYSGAARSFSFKKDVFDELGGYFNTRDTQSGDDDLLIREGVKMGLKIGTVTDRDAFVYTEAKTNFREYLKQKARHISTANYYIFKHKILLTIWHVINLILLLSVLLNFVNIIFIIPFSLKLFFDILTILLLQNRFHYKFNIIEILYLQITYEIMLVVNYINATLTKPEWK